MQDEVIIKGLIQLGNSKALVIEKTLLEAAGLDETALFQIIIDPRGRLIIQSVKPINENPHKKAFREALKENEELLKRLAKR